MTEEIQNKLNQLQNNNIDTVKLTSIINSNNNKIYDINNLVNKLNISLDNSLNQDNLLKAKLDIIDNKRNEINTTFTIKNEKCKQYMNKFHTDNNKQKKLFNLYINTVSEIFQKNKEYNITIDNLLDEYDTKYMNYINSTDILYPKNYLIQLVTNIIFINENKYKMNILFKEAIKEEINNQIKEINSIERITEKIKLNKEILIECENIYELIENLNKEEENIIIKEDILLKLSDMI